MKKICAVVITITLAFLINAYAKSTEQVTPVLKSSATETGAEVRWYNFNEGIKQAIARHRPILIDFYADWCVWCKKMEAEVFTEAQVARKLKDSFICIRIVLDKDPKETIKYKNHTLLKREFLDMLGIQHIPTVVFMDKDTNLITKFPGYIRKDIFLHLLGYIGEECYEKKISFNEYMEGKIPCSKTKK